MSDTVLALDISMSMGWAIGDPEMERPTSGVYRTYNWPGHQEDRVFEFWTWLEAKHKKHGFGHIVYEFTFIDAKRFDPDFIECQKAYVAMVWLFCRMHGIRVAQCPVNVWRARFLGESDKKQVAEKKGPENRTLRRELNKEAAKRACHARGWLVEDDNEAEACGILVARLCELWPGGVVAQRNAPHARRLELRQERARYFGQ